LRIEGVGAIISDPRDRGRRATAGGGKVLVHCFSGVSRSATFVAFYLIAG